MGEQGGPEEGERRGREKNHTHMNVTLSNYNHIVMVPSAFQCSPVPVSPDFISHASPCSLTSPVFVIPGTCQQSPHLQDSIKIHSVCPFFVWFCLCKSPVNFIKIYDVLGTSFLRQYFDRRPTKKLIITRPFQGTIYIKMVILWKGM